MVSSISFPTIFKNNQTQVVVDQDATKTNLRLLLGSEVNSLFGDPAYGCPLKQAIYALNNIILKNILIDAIYTSIQTYLPQVSVKRNNIKITSTDNKTISAQIICMSTIDGSTNMYDIQLLNTDEI